MATSDTAPAVTVLSVVAIVVLTSMLAITSLSMFGIVVGADCVLALGWWAMRRKMHG